MDAPKWVIDKLYEANPDARLGWDGPAGRFALIELRPIKAESIIGCDWDHRGEIYGKAFDGWTRKPMYIIAVDAGDVFSGKVIADLKRWSTNFKQREVKRRQEQGDDYENHVREMSAEQGEYLYWKAQRSNDTGASVVPRKHLTQQEKDVLSGEHRRPLNDVFMENHPNAQPLM